MAEPSFFPYNPRAMRLALFVAAALCVVLASWALSNALETFAITAWARLGVAAGLALAFAYMLLRIRPREGWGVRVEPLVLTVFRPLSGEPLQIPWSSVLEVRRDGKKRERLLVLLQPEGRVLLARHLFASRAEFERLATLLEERAPVRRYDA